jgi:septal ring factor EnvC (AmiA/AmiB activator)
VHRTLILTELVVNIHNVYFSVQGDLERKQMINRRERLLNKVSDFETFDPELAAAVYLTSLKERQRQENNLAAVQDLVASRKTELRRLHQETQASSKKNEELFACDSGMQQALHSAPCPHPSATEYGAAAAYSCLIVVPVTLLSIPSHDFCGQGGMEWALTFCVCAALQDSFDKLQCMISKVHALQEENAHKREQTARLNQEADVLQSSIISVEHNLAAAILERQQNASAHAAKVWCAMHAFCNTQIHFSFIILTSKANGICRGVLF